MKIEYIPQDEFKAITKAARKGGWTERAVHLADRVVTMVDATAPGLHPQEVALAEVPDTVLGSRTAVFVHPDGTPSPRRTREHLALRPETRHPLRCRTNIVGASHI